MDMEKVNSMDFGEFVDVFGNVVERCPLIAAAVWSQRPFSNSEDLEKHFFAFIDALPQSGTLLDAKIDDLWSQQIRHVYPYIPACAMPKAQAVGFQERLKKTGSIEMVRPTQDNRLTWPVRSPVRLGQEGILRCHPDLAGRELQQGTLTAESRREQRGAGLMSLDAAERLRLAELNAQYRARFGFPFVLAARLSDRAAVPGELARRLQRPPAEELRTALGEVKKIGRLRLADLLGAAGLAGP